MALIQSGASASDTAVVDSVARALRTGLYGLAGDPAVRSENDQPTTAVGVVSLGKAGRSVVPVRVDRLGSLASSSHIPMLAEPFEGSTNHALRWNQIATTMTGSQSTVTGFVFNSGLINTFSTGLLLQSTRKFALNLRNPLHFKARAKLAHVNNAVLELGFSDVASSTGGHTTGAYWQITSTGVLQPVITFNSVDITGTDIKSLVTLSNYYSFEIFRDDDNIVFICQDSSTGLIISKQTLTLSLTGQRQLSATQINAFARQYHTASAPATAPQLTLADVNVSSLDQNQNKPWSQVSATLNRSAYEHPFSGAQIAQWSNSAEPSSASLSNTAPGYTSLGGKFQFAAVSGSTTDYCLFGFTVPSPANLVINAVDIETWNTGVIGGLTGTLFTWGLAIGTAASLATAQTRLALGAQDFPISVSLGARSARISKNFTTPIVVPAGKVLMVILRIPIGLGTGSQVFSGMVNFDGYFE